MRFSVDGNSFVKDKKPMFFLSGEVHYFRIARDLWPLHLDRLKESGVRGVTTYVPWFWHEPEEGKFDFTGQTVPETDIAGFLDLCAERDLLVGLKPGPYVLAELLNQGIPEWFIEAHPETLVEGPAGKKNIPYVVSFMHETYLEYAMKWFDKVMEVISPRQLGKNGTVSLMQICNEVGLQQWLNGIGDYAPVTRGYYVDYLKEKYGQIQELNSVYGTSYKEFNEVKPPLGDAKSSGDFAKYTDWHSFHRAYYVIYMERLMNELKNRGADVLFYENVPGWVYGRGNEFPVNINLYAGLRDHYPNLVLGLDHIPENISFRNMHDDWILNGMVKSIQGGRGPIFLAELQAGSREHNVRSYPNELEFFYKSCLAHGVTGMNYYMFSQGKNPVGRGSHGPTFYWDTPLLNDATPTPLYECVKRISGWIDANESSLLESNVKSDMGICFYRPYYETEFFYPLFLKDCTYRAGEVGLKYDIKAYRDVAYYEALLKIYQILNRPYDFVDMPGRDLAAIKAFPVFWMFSLDRMDAETQTVLADYVSSGGHLIITPTLPYLDLEMRPCRILRDALGIDEQDSGSPLDQKVSWFGSDAIKTLPPFNYYNEKGVEVVGRDREGKACGVRKNVGKGMVTVIGASLTYDTEQVLSIYDRIIGDDISRQSIYTDNPDINVVVREGSSESFIFLMNYHPVKQRFSLYEKEGGERLSGELVLDETTCMVYPYKKKLSERGLEIKFCSAEVFSFEENEKSVHMVLRSKPGYPIDILIKGPESSPEIIYSNRSLEVQHEGKKGEWRARCEHANEEDKLTIQFA
ncbi:MAG: beta-galactosidase [Candidatus Theseobacter exili]|nr:beta-galactosidase [Candidatus Theseobacter exili]